MMCKAEKLNKDVFEDMPLSRRQDICLSLFHCLNWFGELVRVKSPRAHSQISMFEMGIGHGDYMYI